MTPPLRRYMLNRQIALAARCIAHDATLTCRSATDSDIDDEHTKNCNALKRSIEKLALEVKLAAVQPPTKGSTQRDEATEPERRPEGDADAQGADSGE